MDFDQFLTTTLSTPTNDDVCAYDALLNGEMPRFHVSMPKNVDDADAASPDDWLSWRLAAPTRRALLVQLGAPRLLIVLANDRVCAAPGHFEYSLVTKNDRRTVYPTFVIDGSLAVRRQSGGGGDTLVFVARSLLWSARRYHGAVDTLVRRAKLAREFVDRRTFVGAAAATRFEVVYAPIQAPNQRASVERGGHVPACLQGIALDGVERWDGAACASRTPNDSGGDSE